MKSKSTTAGRTALLLIDLQNDFVEGGALAVSDGLAVIEVANRLMTAFEWVVATQDWHPSDHQSFASQHPELAVGDQFTLGGLPQTAWPDHCVANSHGAAFVAGLNQDLIDRVVQKGTDKQIDSYSGFFDNGHRHSTGLADELREHGIESLFAMGLATDYCVRATVLDAITEGFQVTLIVDGCRGVELNCGDIERSIHDMKTAGAKMVSSHELLK